MDPLLGALEDYVMAAHKLHADDTPIPVLAPGTGKTKRLIQSRLRGGKQGCLDVFDGLVCTHWGGRHEVGAGTCQGFTNR
jgi:hypothetical protein